MRVVAVKFKREDSRVYSSRDFYYKTFLDVHVGEEVIVNTRDRGLQVAMVSVDNVTSPSYKGEATDYIVQVIDTEPYDFYTSYDERMNIMKSKMKMKMTSMQEQFVYDALIQSYEELSRMVSSFKANLNN